MSCTCGQLDILYNFISPITGRILADPNYVLVGNRDGIAIPSPILIDVRLDLIALRKRYNSLVKGDIVIGHPNNELPNAQVLFNLANGYLYTTDGILSTNPIIPIGDLPDLEYKHIWIGDVTNRPVPQQRVTLDNLPSFLSANPLNNLGLYNLYTGQFSVTSPTQVGNPSITQRIDMSNMPHLSKGKMWIGKINYIPPVITIDGIFPYVHVVGSLNWSAPGVPPGDGDAVPTEIGLDPGEIFIGDPANPGQIIASDIIQPLLSLTYKRIWRGNASNRPEEVDDLTLLETNFNILKARVDHIEFVSLPIIDADLLALHAELGVMHLAIAALEFTVNTLHSPAIAFLLGEVNFVIPAALAGLSSRITTVEDRTLDQIPLAVNVVNLNNQRIGNLADPTTPLSAVNLQTMQAAISAATGGLIVSVTGTANQITANTVAGAVTLSLPADVIISTSLSAGNLELIGNSLISTNTNGNILLNPNGTGNIDTNNHKIINLADPTNPLDAVNYQSMTALTNRTLDQIPLAAANVNINNHKLINVSDPTNPLDAVNLQTMTAAIGAGTITSVTGTTNQVTASTLSGAVTLSLPSTVIVSTSIAAANMELNTNVLQSTNTNGSISVSPNGSGNLLLIPSPGTGLVGVKGTPSYPLDVFGTSRAQRVMGNTSVTFTVAPGVVSITGTGRTVVQDGSEVGGSITLNTGTGISASGILLTITFGTAMATSAYSVVLTAGTLTAAGLPLYVIKTSTSAFTIRCTTNLANSTTYTFNYHVIAN